MRIFLASLALVCLLAPTTVHAGPCAEPFPLVGPVTTQVDGGGVLVVQTFAFAPDPAMGTGAVVQERWRFKVNGKLVKPVIQTIAPGLAAYRLPDGAKAPAELTDGKIALAKLGAAKATAELAAPKVTGITHEAMNTRRGTYETVLAELAEPAPAALALVIQGDKGARSFGMATPGDKQVVLYRTGSCMGIPAGTQPTKAGDKVKVFWVDHTGRTSAATAVTVKTAPGARAPSPGD